MRHLSSAAMLAIALMAAAPAGAETLTAQGVTREKMVAIMTRHGLPVRIAKDSKGNVIVKSRIVDINSDIYFFICTDGGCREIQFAAGWSNSKASQDEVNERNSTKRYLRVYSKPDRVIWADQNVIVGRTTAENIDEYLTTWSTAIARFNEFMNL
jgi:hypothetical protein